MFQVLTRITVFLKLGLIEKDILIVGVIRSYFNLIFTCEQDA